MAHWFYSNSTTAPEEKEEQGGKKNEKGTKKILCQKIVAFYRNGTTKHVFTFYFNIVIVIMVMKVYGFDTIKVECSYSLGIQLAGIHAVWAWIFSSIWFVSHNFFYLSAQLVFFIYYFATQYWHRWEANSVRATMVKVVFLSFFLLLLYFEIGISLTLLVTPKAIVL